MKNRINLTSFISIGLLFSFLLMLFSGIALYVAPEGSISRWIGWNMLGLNKNDWENQHVVFSFVFILFALLHIFIINWKLLVLYFRSEKNKSVISVDFVVIIILILALFIATKYNLKPVSKLVGYGRVFSHSLVKNTLMPDIANPDQLTLPEFAKLTHISYDELVLLLQKKGFTHINKE
ncbi:MAG: DUF4405 domain-containing protein, partial [Ignavibacteriaceae bacterium]|nr:DUF4405 domain-containing protein [Ignavibacteriaceae bacterium]